MSCPQCHAPIDGITHDSYGVGWCRRDVHRACLPLHVRTCAACRAPNEGWIAQQPLADGGPVRTAPTSANPSREGSQEGAQIARQGHGGHDQEKDMLAPDPSLSE